MARLPGKLKPVLPPGSEEDTSDRALLKAAMRGVRPLRQSGRIQHPPRQLPKEAAQKRRDAAQAAPPPTGAALSDAYSEDLAHLQDATSFRANGVQPEVLRRLKNETHRIRASLDLHGMTVEQARNQLEEFINFCCAKGLRRVRIVHGQGYGSRMGTPILKLQTRHWLRQIPEVMAYVTPDAYGGAGGAVFVLLKTFSPKD